MRPSRLPRLLLCFSLSLLLSLSLGLGLAPPSIGQEHNSPQVLAQAGQAEYRAGDFEQAEQHLQQALRQYQAAGNGAGEAMVLSNLALVLGQQGEWAIAQDYLSQSLAQIQTLPESEQPFLKAQILNVRGRLQLAQGQADAAAQSWNASATAYQTLGDVAGEIRSRLRQARAVQALGFYEKAAREILQPLKRQLDTLPDSTLKAAGLLQWGESQSNIGSLREAQETFRQSLQIAQAINAADAIAAAQLSLANALYAEVVDGYRRGELQGTEEARLLQRERDAIALYETIESSNPNSSNSNALRTRLNHLQLLLETAPWRFQALEEPVNLEPELRQISTQIQSITDPLVSLPPTRSNLEIRINFANQLLDYQLDLEDLAEQRPSEALSIQEQTRAIPDPGMLLSQAVAQAEAAGDLRSQAYALGVWGKAVAQQGDLQQGLKLTDEAALLAKRVNAPEIVYRWYEQRGQLLETMGDRKGAIAAYSSAVQTLKTLRTDLIAVNPEVLFSFQKSVEPTYRQLMSLLLAEAREKASQDQDILGAVRSLVESLQQEELTNFLQANCLQSTKVDLENIEGIRETAFIYPIILPDQLAIITSLPGPEGGTEGRASGQAEGQAQRKLALFSSPVDQFTLEDTVRTLRSNLLRRHSLGFQTEAKQVYDWLMAPIAETLETAQVETLVFVMDGVLRNLPPAVLFDGQRYLIEQYALATTPGLQLAAPQPLQEKVLETLAFGITEEKTITLPENCTENASEDCQQITFGALPAVEPELERIAQAVPATKILLDKDFKQEHFQAEVGQSESPIVHLATHGQFSSAREETFVLADDGVINVEQFAEVLEAREKGGRSPIELLVLSACETATGDDRAALGLAGLALRSGARSTVASLWAVSDDPTALMMQRFYQELNSQEVTKAEALRRAQLQILEDPLSRRHPYFWAPFILVGNWL